MWTQIILYYVWIAFIEFLFLVLLETLVNHLRKKHPDAKLSTIDFTNREMFFFSLLWPRQVLDIVFKFFLKPLFKKGA